MSNIADRIHSSGKSIRKISSASGISEPRLLEIIEGAEPTLAELRQLASALGISITQFTLETEEHSKAAFLFRHTMMSKLRPSQMPTVDLLSWQIERSLELLPSFKLPPWINSFEGPHESYIDALSDSETFRNLFFMSDLASPILRLPTIVQEKMGVLLMIVKHPKIDGASAIIDGTPFIFISPRFPPRMLFTLAHEIGHLIAHYRFGSEFAILDPEKATGNLRPNRDKRERFADAFASCLLLPVSGVGIALKTIREVYKVPSGPVGDIEILYLSHIFGVSFQVAAKRCEDLELLPAGGAFSLYERLCKQYGSPEKRARELNLPPRPEVVFPSVPMQLLESAVEKVRNGEISIGRVAASLNITISQLVDANRSLTT